MGKVVVTSIKPNGKTSIVTTRVRTASGEYMTRRKIDANSPTLANDITEVFKRNVAKARQAKK